MQDILKLIMKMKRILICELFCLAIYVNYWKVADE